MIAELLYLALSGASVPCGNWVIVTPGDEINPVEIERWNKALRNAEEVVERYFNSSAPGEEKLPMPAKVRVRVAPSSGDFAAWTGCTIWQGAAVKNGGLVTQPLEVLERRGVLDETLIHEYVHLALGPYKVPLWLNEGLAVICSGQMRTLGGEKDLPRKVEEVEKLLVSSDTNDMRRGYLAAAALTCEKIKSVGLQSLIRLIKEEEI